MPSCNLFFRQLLKHPKNLAAPATQLLGLPDAGSADFDMALRNYGVGVNAECYIPRASFVGGQDGYLGNIANLILCVPSRSRSSKSARAGRRCSPSSDGASPARVASTQTS